MSKQNTINSQDVLRSFKSNKKERFWKEKFTALAVLLSLGLILYFIFSGNKTKDFASRFHGNIATKTNLILYLSAKNGELSGCYYDYCDSTIKIKIKGTLEKNGKFVLNELEENNRNPNTLKGALGEDGSLIGERVENISNTKSSFYFARITSKLGKCKDIVNIETPDQTSPGVAESTVNIPSIIGGTNNGGTVVNNPNIIGGGTVVKNPIKDRTNNGGIVVDNQTTPQKIKLVFKGTIDVIKGKIEDRTKKEMATMNYSAEKITFSKNNSYYKFTCDLVPNTSANFFKIGLYYGPKNEGKCTSCEKVLTRNPGSKALYKDEDSDYYYSVIAIPRN